MENLLKKLEELNIEYENHTHPAIFTAEDAEKCTLNIPGTCCKNLFLKTKKGNFYLVVTPALKTINLKSVEEKIGSKRLSFASAERLKEIFNLTPGSVTPFGVMNDKDNIVKVILDQSIMTNDLINVHPLTNTASTALTPNNLVKFIEHHNNKYEIIAL